MVRSCACLAAALCAVVVSSSHLRARLALDDVRVDAVVVDDDGQPVTGLDRAQFRVRQDGRLTAIDSFTEVTAVGASGRDQSRTVAIVLDDSAVPAGLTARVQDVARGLVNRGGPSDTISVMRLNSRTDEPAGGTSEALDRIAAYRAGSIPFFGRETLQNALTLIRKVSDRLLDGDEVRRKTIVCVGSPLVFDVREPIRREGSLLWPYWVDALTATARAHVSVYVVSPRGLMGPMWVTGHDLVDATGGAAFVNTVDFDRAINQIWREASHYYVVGYRAPLPDGRLHDVEVSVSRSGVHVHARRTRG